MTHAPMHENEWVMRRELAARLVAAQFPAWSGLALQALGTAGSDNALFRLGRDMVLRFPRTAGAAAAIAVEVVWLPRIAAHLPLEVPVVLASGQPGEGYPYRWSVLPWIEGQDAFGAPPADELASARALAGFVAALRAVPVPADAPRMPEGGHLRPRDAFTRQMIARITDEADPTRVAQVWDAALALPPWTGKAVLVHADLHPLNLLTRTGALVAVIDWGAFCAGDPALDLICAWTVLGPAGRRLFRDLLSVDAPTWARGRALAFSKAVMAAPYYRDSNPALRDVMRRTLTQTIGDWPD